MADLASADTAPARFCGGTSGIVVGGGCECGADADVLVWAVDSEGREIEDSEYGVCWRCLHDSLRPD